MNFKNVSVKLLAIVMTLAMMFSICAPTISAVVDDLDAHDHGESEELIYVSLGDSTTNGYGLSGYEFDINSDEYKQMIEDFNEWKASNFYEGETSFVNPNGLLMETPAAYPALFRDYLNTLGYNTNLIQLGVSAMRADDVLTLLTWGTEDQFKLDDYSGNKSNGKYIIHNFHDTGLPFEWEFKVGGDNNMNSMAELYQKSVQSADIISINLGSNNFSIYLWGCLGPAIMGMLGMGSGEAEYEPKMEEILKLVDDELAAEGMEIYAEVKAMMMEQLAAYLPAESLAETCSNIADYATYTFVSYCYSYAKILDRINELNPDADIYLMSVVNFMKGFSVDIGTETPLDMSKFIGLMLDAANAYVAGMAAYKTESNEDFNNVYFANTGDDVEMLMSQLEPLAEKNFEGASVLHKRMIDSLSGWMGTFSGGAISFPHVDSEHVTALKKLTDKAADEIDIMELLALCGTNNPADLPSSFASFDVGLATETANYLGLERAMINSTKKGAVDVEFFNTLLDGSFMTDISSIFGNMNGVIADYGIAHADDYNGLRANIKKSIADTLIIPQIPAGTPEEYIPVIVDQKIAEYGLDALIDELVQFATVSDALEYTLSNNDTSVGMLYIMAYFMVADGVVCHPSENGHKTMFNSLKSAYENEHTAMKETLKNLESLLNVLYENYDDAYAFAYDEAVAAGVIAKINAYLDAAIEAINNAEATLNEYKDFARSEEFVAEVEATFEQARKTVRTLQALINNADELDAETYEYILALLGDLATDLDNISDLLGIAVIDFGHYVDPMIVELNEQAKAQIAILKAEIEAQIAALRAEVEAKIAALKAEAEAKIAELKAQLENAIGEAKAAIEAEIARIEAELAAAIAALEAEINAKIAALEAELEAAIAAVKARTEAEIAKLRAAVEALIADAEALNDAVKAAVEGTVAAVNGIIDAANKYFKENLPEAYDKLVALVLAQIPEADKYLYDWFYNNPEVVIEFFAEYGDDMLGFLVENAEYIVPVIGFIVMNYGEDVINYVLNNADVLLPAFVSWYSVYGDRVWAMLDVYLNALGVDTSIFTPEGLVELLNNLFVLIGDLGEEFASDAWDKLVATGIIDEILAAVEQIKLQAWEQLDYVNNQLKAQLDKQLAILYGELADLQAKLDAAIKAGEQALVAQLNAAIAKVEAAIAELENMLNELDAMIREFNAAVEELINTVNKIEASIREIIDAIENVADLDELNRILGEAIADLADAIVDAIEAAGLVDKLQNAVAILLEEGFDAMIEYLKAIGTAWALDVAETLEALMNEALTELEDFVAATITDLATKINAAIKTMVENALSSEYLVTEDSNYLAIGADPDGFAKLLADKLKLTDDAFTVLGWDEIDVEAILKADLITLSFNENMLNSFAVGQTMGYLNGFVSNDLKPSLNAYVVKAFTEFFANANPKPTAAAQEELIGMISAMLNQTVDGVANDFLGNATVTDMDWAALVGEENVKYVDEARAAMRKELLAAGVPETMPIYIPVLDLFFANIDAFGDAASFIKMFEPADIYAMFGENAVYTVEVPVLDALVFAGESYAYSYAQFTRTYAQTVTTITQLNPEALVVLLGHYNAFDGIALDNVDLGEIYGNYAKFISVHPFAHALLTNNVIYVDIAEAETVFGALADTTEVTVFDFISAYLTDATITDLSAEGNEYVYAQILKALNITCAHFDIDNDHNCDYCDEILSECTDDDKDHKCDLCEKVLSECADDDKDHKCDLCGVELSKCADDDKDHKCDLCGVELSKCADDDKDHKCDLCEKVLSECADADKDHKCDLCEKVLSECADENKDHKCDLCEKVLSECADADKDHKCDLCEKVLSECADADKDHKCDLCEKVLSECADENKDHKCDVCEKAMGECADADKDGLCDYGCGKEFEVEPENTDKPTEPIVKPTEPTDVGTDPVDDEKLPAAAIAGIAVGSVLILGGAGFVVFRFVFKKKIF